MGYITEAWIEGNMFYVRATDYGNCVAYFKVFADDKQIAEYTGGAGGGGYPIPVGTKTMHAVGMDAGAGSPQTPKCQSGYEVNRISVAVPVLEENLGIYSLYASEVSGGIAVDVGLRGSGTLRIYVNDVLKDTHVTQPRDESYNTVIPLGAGTYSVKAVGTGSSQTVSVTVSGYGGVQARVYISAIGSGEVYIGSDKVTATTVTRPIGGSVYVFAKAYPGNVFQKWIVVSERYGIEEFTNNPQNFYVGQDFSIQAVFVSGTGNLCCPNGWSYSSKDNLCISISGEEAEPPHYCSLGGTPIEQAPPIVPVGKKYKLVFQFSGALSTTLSSAATEILHIMSDIIARITGGYVGTPYYEGSDKLVFMVGTMGAGGIEGFIASSPKLISLAKWFASLFGLVLVSSYITEVTTGVLTTINIAQTDAIVDKCLSSSFTDEAKADCVKRALDLGKPTDWGTIVFMLGGLAVGAFLLKDVLGGKR